MTVANRIVIASNRLPVVLSRDSGGEWELEPGSGGLVTAMAPVLRKERGIWVGWPGVAPDECPRLDELLEAQTDRLGYRVVGVPLTREEQDLFYLGFANQVIWPLFHDFLGPCNFDPRFWEAYQEVNRKFAALLERGVKDDDFLWVHDYHLMGVAEELRRLGRRQRTAFFLHIPFPPLDVFVKLPWRFSILRSLLNYDLIGFQTRRDKRNFLHCLEALAPQFRCDHDFRVVEARVGSRAVRIGAFPISIDFGEFADVSASDAATERSRVLRSEIGGRKLILGVDRLDYTKGIAYKLRGFRRALERYPEMRGAVTLVQLVVPSREDIPEYDQMKREIEQLVGEISGRFSRPGWVPIHYRYGTWDRTELVAHYRAADAALVTPLKDGMNLVAKEYCASNVDDDGVLILSEYAGFSAQAGEDALLVNPYDVDEVAEAVHTACTMEEPERRARMGRLRAGVRKEDIHWWVSSFLQAAREGGVGGDPGPERYLRRAPEGFLETAEVE
jgi:trehalose 6-phosphate synthase/phosphatase